MKPKELCVLNNGELHEKLTSFREELFRLRFQHASGQLEKTAKIPRVKQRIAQILTILRERKKEFK